MINWHFAIDCPAMRKLLALLTVASFLAACGYKGPLYLPTATPAAKATPAPAKTTQAPAKAASAAVKASAVSTQ